MGNIVYGQTTDGTAVPLQVDADGVLQSSATLSGNVTASTEYTEGATDATITGGAILWEDTGDTLRAVSAAKPLPVSLPTTPTANLASIASQTADVATETTLAGIDAKITAVDTGAVTVAASALPTGAATETTLAAINGKVTAVNTGAVVVSASALPSGAATGAAQTTGNTSLGNIDTNLGAAADTAASADTGTFSLIAIAKRVVAKLTSLIALFPSALSNGFFQVSVKETIALPITDNSGSLTVDGTVTVGAITAGETHVGEVAGSGKGVKVALTVSTSPAYTAGDSIGGKITIANAVRVSGGAAILASLQILDRANQRPTGAILIYDADPSAATLTDNAAVVNSTDDLKIVAAIPVAASDWVTINNKAYANLSALARVVQAASGTTLYASFVVTSTPTFAATTDMQVVFNFVYIN